MYTPGIEVERCIWCIVDFGTFVVAFVDKEVVIDFGTLVGIDTVDLITVDVPLVVKFTAKDGVVVAARDVLFVITDVVSPFVKTATVDIGILDVKDLTELAVVKLFRIVIFVGLDSLVEEKVTIADVVWCCGAFVDTLTEFEDKH